MKKVLTTTLAIALSWAPTFAQFAWDDPNFDQMLEDSHIARTQGAEVYAKEELAQINDLATLEKIAKDDRDPLMQRFAIEKLNEMKKSSVMTNETNEAGQASLETPPAQPEKPASNKPLLWVLVVALLAIIGGVVAWKKKR